MVIMNNFNIRSFYKEREANKEKAFTENTGLSIRHSFQQYNEGTDSDDVFAVKTSSKKVCFGVEFHGSISYLLPASHEKVLVFIFDKSFMPIINAISSWSEYRIKVFGKHIPSMMNALSNASQNDFGKFGIFVDEEMLCFAKQIEYPLFDNINKGYITEPLLIREVISLVQFRNLCESELTAFNGFSAKEESEIALREGFAMLKKGLRYARFADYLSSI